jgi:hypothetical protein
MYWQRRNFEAVFKRLDASRSQRREVVRRFSEKAAPLAIVHGDARHHCIQRYSGLQYSAQG